MNSSSGVNLDNIKLQLRQHSRVVMNNLSLDQIGFHTTSTSTNRHALTSAATTTTTTSSTLPTSRNVEWYNKFCQSSYKFLLRSHLEDIQQQQQQQQQQQLKRPMISTQDETMGLRHENKKQKSKQEEYKLDPFLSMSDTNFSDTSSISSLASTSKSTTSSTSTDTNGYPLRHSRHSKHSKHLCNPHVNMQYYLTPANLAYSIYRQRRYSNLRKYQKRRIFHHNVESASESASKSKSKSKSIDITTKPQSSQSSQVLLTPQITASQAPLIQPTALTPLSSRRSIQNMQNIQQAAAVTPVQPILKPSLSPSMTQKSTPLPLPPASLPPLSSSSSLTPSSSSLDVLKLLQNATPRNVSSSPALTSSQLTQLQLGGLSSEAQKAIQGISLGAGSQNLNTLLQLLQTTSNKQTSSATSQSASGSFTKNKQVSSFFTTSGVSSTPTTAITATASTTGHITTPTLDFSGAKLQYKTPLTTSTTPVSLGDNNLYFSQAQNQQLQQLQQHQQHQQHQHQEQQQQALHQLLQQQQLQQLQQLQQYGDPQPQRGRSSSFDVMAAQGQLQAHMQGQPQTHMQMQPQTQQQALQGFMTPVTSLQEALRQFSLQAQQPQTQDQNKN